MSANTTLLYSCSFGDSRATFLHGNILATKMSGTLRSSYFFGGLTGPGSLTHAPEVPVNIWQMQGPLQGLVALHVPVQVGSRLGFFCNCRAETVPAQKTAIMMAANERFWMVFLMICPSFQLQEPDEGPVASSYFKTDAPGMGCDEQNGLPVSMGTIQRQPVWQGLVALQPPPQVAEPFASLRNCRAETVPAQRTPMTSVVKNIELIFFMIAFLLVPCSRTERSRTERWSATGPVWLQ